MAPEDACAADMLVLIRWQGRPWLFRYRNWLPSIPTNPLPRPLAIGITGYPRATASEPEPLRKLTERPKLFQDAAMRFATDKHR
jgi:hypothetical protein